MTFKQLYLRALPMLIAAPIVCLYLMGTSDYEDLLHIEGLKQEQRDRVQAASANVRQAYAMNPLHKPKEVTTAYLSPTYTTKSDLYSKSTEQIKKGAVVGSKKIEY